MNKEKFIEANRTPWAYLALAIHIACMAVAASFSWIAFVCVIFAIFTQIAWQLYLEERTK